MLDAYEGTIDADGSETLEVARDEVRGYFSPERQPLPEHSFIALDGDVAVAAVLVSRYEGLPLIAYVMTETTHKGRGLPRRSRGWRWPRCMPPASARRTCGSLAATPTRSASTTDSASAR